MPSLTTPLSLVKHATFVEKVWSHSRVGGVPRGHLGLADTIESVRDAFLAACRHSRSIAAGHDLDDRFPWHQGPVTLRFIYAHMVAELARHAGHGDILVEQLMARRG